MSDKHVGMIEELIDENRLLRETIQVEGEAQRKFLDDLAFRLKKLKKLKTFI